MRNWTSSCSKRSRTRWRAWNEWMLFARQTDAHPFMMQDAQAELEDWIGEKADQNLPASGLHARIEFLGQWIKHGGFWPDPKLRFFRRGRGRFEDRAVHETVKVNGPTAKLEAWRNPAPLLSHAFRLHRAHEPLFFAGRGDGRRRRTHRIQRDQYRGPAAGSLLSTTIFFAWVFSTAEKDCCCIFTTQFTFPGNTPKLGTGARRARP